MSRARLIIRESKSDSNEDNTTPSTSTDVKSKGRKSRGVSKVEPSILKDMTNLPYSDNVKQCANSIFVRFTNNKTYRSQRRLRLIFYCIYSAHKELDLDVNPAEVAKIVGIDPRNCSKALSLFSEVQTGYRPPQTSSTPQHFLSGYCTKLNIKDEETKTIIALADNILRKEPNLREKSPQKIAAGVLKYWMNTSGIKMSDEQYAEVVMQSSTTIKCIVNEIEIIDNR